MRECLGIILSYDIFIYSLIKGKSSREKEHNHQQTNSLKTLESTSYNNMCVKFLRKQNIWVHIKKEILPDFSTTI